MVKARSQAGTSYWQVVQLLQAEGYKVAHVELESLDGQMISHDGIAGNLISYLNFGMTS